jgi:ubiquinone/menaquinone biosynthesis C-methylase UbiE
MNSDPAGRFPETADIETASQGYAARFAGPVGGWMLSVQEQIVATWLGDRAGASVLDVGGGHGQLAVPMSAWGLNVTVLGSSDACRERIRAGVESGKIAFKVGNMIELPFEDRSFDVVVSIRLLPHCEKWKQLISELCRAARASVIVDYPTGQSLNCLSGMLFGAKKRMEGNTRPFTLFSHAQVRDAFREHGFRPAGKRPQFFVPMVVHRMLKCPAASRFMEGCSRGLGLTRLLGSPVLARFERGADPS